MRPQTRSRIYREGRTSRRRTYTCRRKGCGRKFQVDTLKPIPERERICGHCHQEELWGKDHPINTLRGEP